MRQSLIRYREERENMPSRKSLPGGSIGNRQTPTEEPVTLVARRPGNWENMEARSQARTRNRMLSRLPISRLDRGEFPALRRWGVGLSDAATPATGTSFWGSIGSTLGGIVSSVLPSFTQIQLAKYGAKAQTDVLAAQAGLYTPQNIETLRRQAEYEAQVRANAAAAASGSTSAPISTNMMIGLGVGAVALMLFMGRKK